MTPAAFKSLSDPAKRVDWLVENSADLPPQARTAMKVIRLVDQRNTSAGQVASALSTDQVLTARVLKLANSVYYGAPRRISTLTDAIVMLGMRSIGDMAMSVSCQDILEKEVLGYGIRRGDLFKHSNCCGYTAQLLAKRSGYHIAEEAFVAGLLHDIGKVIISHKLADEFQEITELSYMQGISFSEAERQVLGFDHAEIGARMAERWNMPTQLVTAIRYHHTPHMQPENSPLPWLVHLADVICMMLGIGLGGDGLRYEFEEGSIEALKLSESAIEQVISQVTEYATLDPEQAVAGARR